MGKDDKINSSLKKKLEAAGWKVGSVDKFLDLAESEMMLLNMKIALAKKVKAVRKAKRFSQQKLAKLVGSSQSRIAKLKSADRSVSIELLIKTLAAMGTSRAQIGKIDGSGQKTKSGKRETVKN